MKNGAFNVPVDNGPCTPAGQSPRRDFEKYFLACSHCMFRLARTLSAWLSRRRASARVLQTTAARQNGCARICAALQGCRGFMGGHSMDWFAGEGLRVVGYVGQSVWLPVRLP